MWVRTQNGKILINSNDVAIFAIEKNNIVCYFEKLEYNFIRCIIGEYTTIEKSVKVLDLLRKQLDNELTNKSFSCDKGNYHGGGGCKLSNTFILPKENELE